MISVDCCLIVLEKFKYPIPTKVLKAYPDIYNKVLQKYGIPKF